MDKNNILLVEDNPDDELLALHALKKNNITHQVRVVRDGMEAVEYLTNMDEGDPLPKLVLLDLQLPKMGGLEVLKVIRECPALSYYPLLY
jgi:CheY-like chemotaxis protein